MICKLIIRTPKGKANGTEKKLRWFILGRLKPQEIYINKDDSELVWVIDAPLRKFMKISKNVGKFKFFMNTMLDNKLVKATIRKKLNPEQEKELVDMLMNQTEVEIIKAATPDETEEAFTTLWDRVKATFKKIKPT